MAGDQNDISVGELSRQIASALARIESIATKFETQYVRKELYELAEKSRDLSIEVALSKADTASKALDNRLTVLEGDRTWLQRVIYGALILAVLGTLTVGSRVLIK